MTEEPLPHRRWVVDTNVIVSRVLRPHGVPAQAFRRAIDLGTLLFSTAAHRKLVWVMRRPKFDACAPWERRLALLRSMDNLIDWVVPARAIRACRDPRDDKFPEVAVHGDADALVTGDEDLLALNPFHGVAIVSPQQFLALWSAGMPS